MNLLIFVFSLLLIFSYSFSVAFEKFKGERKIRSSYLGHINANRKILSAYETELYKAFPSKPNPVQTTPISNSTKKITKPILIPKINPECARLNIASLLSTNIEENRLLYDLTAKLIKIFYGAPLLQNKPHAEYQFLDTFLKTARAQEGEPLEKLNFHNPDLQEIYYQMLKGTKKSYPSLLDYIVMIPHSRSPICLYHAHPLLLTVFFGEKASIKIYNEMHKPEGLPVTEEVIERLCNENHTPVLQPEIFKFLQLGKPIHKNRGKKALIQTDDATAITLRKTLQLKFFDAS